MVVIYDAAGTLLFSGVSDEHAFGSQATA